MTATTTAPALPPAYVRTYIRAREVAVLMTTAELLAALEAADVPTDPFGEDWNTPHGEYRAGLVNAYGDTLIARDDLVL